MRRALERLWVVGQLFCSFEGTRVLSCSSEVTGGRRHPKTDSTFSVPASFVVFLYFGLTCSCLCTYFICCIYL